MPPSENTIIACCIGLLFLVLYDTPKPHPAQTPASEHPAQTTASLSQRNAKLLQLFGRKWPNAPPR